MTDRWQALREAEAEATKGPWIGDANHGYVTWEGGDIADVYDGRPPHSGEEFNYVQARANAAFIAMARNAMAELLAENERLRATLAEAINGIESWASYASDYFKEKHDLAGELADLRHELVEAGQQVPFLREMKP